jgi:PHP family Zn ribbon phosphoesterase
MDMTPRNIVQLAKQRGMNIIGISDHNSTLQANLIKQLGEQENILALCGAEVTTKEEVHCLCFFDKDEELSSFQRFINERLSNIPNNVDYFGYQVVVNENNEILDEIGVLLTAAINASIEEIEAKVHKLNGIFIPAHINKSQNSLLSQLGFLPKGLNVDALELSRHIKVEDFIATNAYLSKYSFIQSSDAHFPDDIGKVYTEFYMEEPTFNELRMALRKENGRSIVGHNA